MANEWQQLLGKAESIQLAFERSVSDALKDKYDSPGDKRRKIDKAEDERRAAVAALVEQAKAAQTAVLDKAALDMESVKAREAKRVRDALRGDNSVYAMLLMEQVKQADSEALVTLAQTAPSGFDREFLTQAARIELAQRIAAQPGEVAHHLALTALTPEPSEAEVAAKQAWREAEGWRFEELDQVAYATQVSDRTNTSAKHMGVTTAIDAHAAVQNSVAGMAQGERA
jgi:hypothetical protein